MGHCNDALVQFGKHVEVQMLRVNVLLGVNTIIMVVMVGIGAYGHRYRHHPLTRFLFLGATTLFLPIMSYVVSAIDDQSVISFKSRHGVEIITGLCSPDQHIFLVVLWTGLVQNVGINTTTIVAVDPREGRNIAPPVELFVQAIWTSYLAVTTRGGNREHYRDQVYTSMVLLDPSWTIILVFALIFVKLLFKYYAFYEAGRSSALGSNPRFIVGYMEKIQGACPHGDRELAPPPLIVMGEHRTKMDNDDLVTIDKVWQSDDEFMIKRQPLKDLCFSFALFKLLRCRFARYKIVEADFMKVHNFFWHVLSKVNSDERIQPEECFLPLSRKESDERVFGLIADELSFLHDCYYSSHPISYSKRWLPVIGVIISLLIISYCFIILTARALSDFRYFAKFHSFDVKQIHCENICGNMSTQYGSLLFDLVPVYLLLAIVIISDARDITCYICSDWTKIAIICCYLNKASWQNSPTMQKWVHLLLQCRSKLVKPWVDKMNQCSILVPLPRKTPMVLRRLLRLPEEQKKNVNVPTEVKAAIMDKLRNNKGKLRSGVISLPSSVHVRNSLLGKRNGDGIAETLLVWHIATSIFEVRHPQSPVVEHDMVAVRLCASMDVEAGGYTTTISKTSDRVTATHLSSYCAYLVIYSPELLPDDDNYCKSLYKAVKKDVERVLAGRKAVSSTREEEFLELVKLLGEDSNHEVLKQGVELENKLISQGEGEVWKVLADFWVEMILYVAPSDHLDVQAEAVARGGELITLLWALLTHLGVDTRDEASTAGTAPGMFN